MNLYSHILSLYPWWGIFLFEGRKNQSFHHYPYIICHPRFYINHFWGIGYRDYILLCVICNLLEEIITISLPTTGSSFMTVILLRHCLHKNYSHSIPDNIRPYLRLLIYSNNLFPFPAIDMKKDPKCPKDNSQKRYLELWFLKYNRFSN